MPGAGWTGWHVHTVAPTQLHGAWTPWAACLDASDAPFVRWFAGGATNAAFNEIDRSVLAAEGETVAFISDPGDRPCERLSARALLVELGAIASLVVGIAYCVVLDHLLVLLCVEHRDARVGVDRDAPRSLGA